MFNMFRNKLRNHTHTKFGKSRTKKSAKSSSVEPPSTFGLWTESELSHIPQKFFWPIAALALKLPKYWHRVISWLVLDNCPQKLWVWKLAVLFCLNSLPNNPTRSNSCIHPMLTLASTNKLLFPLPILITPKSNNHSLSHSITGSVSQPSLFHFVRCACVK